MQDDFAPPGGGRPDRPPPFGRPRPRPPLREPPPGDSDRPRPLLVALTGLVVVVLLGAGVWLGIGLLRGDPGPPPPTTPSGAKVETVERLAAATVASFRTAGAVGGPEEACTAAAGRYLAADPRILEPADQALFLRRCVELAGAFP